MADKKKTRPLALGIIKHDGKILAVKGKDRSKNLGFYRIPGGGIEFGEKAIEALKREFREEFDTDLKNIRYLGIIENIFTYENAPGHEICFVYRADLAERSLYKKTKIKIVDHPRDFAEWVDFKKAARLKIYPQGIKKLITLAG